MTILIYGMVMFLREKDICHYLPLICKPNSLCKYFFVNIIHSHLLAQKKSIEVSSKNYASHVSDQNLRDRIYLADYFLMMAGTDRQEFLPDKIAS